MTAKYFFFIFSLIFIVSFTSRCTQSVKEAPSSCDMVSETLELENQTVKLPTKGKFILESHLVTTKDKKWPKSVTENVDAHINRSCNLLSLDCSKIYTTRYHHEWTPAEGGEIGEGAIEISPTVEEEMWSGNMYWKKIPWPNTKFLACNGITCVVVSVGFESGPADDEFLGGLQGEVLYFLGADDSTQILWGRLVDQSLPLGPIKCQNF